MTTQFKLLNLIENLNVIYYIIKDDQNYLIFLILQSLIKFDGVLNDTQII
jgi:hypothetical protein